MILAERYAAQILDGSFSPYTGAKAICRELSYELRPGDHALDPFTSWPDQFDDRVTQRARGYASRPFSTALESW